MSRKSALLLLVLFVVLAACGQKPTIEKQLIAAGGAGGGGAGGGAVETGTDIGTGAGATDTGAGSTAAGSTTTGATAGGTRTTTTKAGPGTATGPGTTAAKPGGPADTTGISASEILIGLHAPVTGAAPFPQTSFESGKDVYWNFVKKQGGMKVLAGRNGRIIFRDDQFDPNTARIKCRELVEAEKVFVLVGGGGADQIKACAEYASSKGVPYLSAGVMEQGLANLPGYFAISMSYPQQSPLLAQLTKNYIKKTKIGIVAANTSGFDDAFESMKKAALGAGLTIVESSRIDKNADANQSSAEIAKYEAKGAEVVYVLASPTVFIQMARGESPTYDPIYIGPGISAGLNTVAIAGCRNINDAKFLSPFPQLDEIDSMDADYTREYRAQNSTNPDDIGLALWGLNKTLRIMFEGAGTNISRQALVQFLESGTEVKTNVYPPLKFGAGKHLGATQAHLLAAECTPPPGRWRTIQKFASGF